jgi:putative PIN family toxin of toxin-antitoxin system
MKAMFDTNIIISAVFSSLSNPSKSILAAEQKGYELCICQEIHDEAIEKFSQKWPELQNAFRDFFDKAAFTVLSTPAWETDDAIGLRDVKDRPIYQAAVAANIDYFVTGDKDFLEFQQTRIRILTATEFLRALEK